MAITPERRAALQRRAQFLQEYKTTFEGFDRRFKMGIAALQSDDAAMAEFAEVISPISESENDDEGRISLEALKESNKRFTPFIQNVLLRQQGKASGAHRVELPDKFGGKTGALHNTMIRTGQMTAMRVVENIFSLMKLGQAGGFGDVQPGKFGTGGLFGPRAEGPAPTLASSQASPFDETALPEEEQLQRRADRLTLGHDPDQLETSRNREELNVIRNKVMGYFGVPENEIERRAWASKVPATAKAVSFLANMAFQMWLFGGGGALTASSRGVAAGTAFPKVGTFQSFLTRSMAGLGRKAPVAGLGALGGGAAGAALNYSTQQYTGPEDTNWTEVMGHAAGGAGLGFFMMTGLMGRPFGPQSRLFSEASRKMQAGATASAAFGTKLGKLGAAWAYAPRLTVGYMAEAGLMGAGFGALHAMEVQGMKPNEAILEGLKEAPLWMIGDIALARIGSTARWAGGVTMFKEQLQKNAVEAGLMGKVGATLTGGNTIGQRKAATVAASAAIGAGVAASAGEDPIMGAIMGAAGGGTLTFFQRAGALMPKKLYEKAVNGQFHAMNAEEVKLFAELLVGDAATVAAGMMDEGTGAVFLRAIGTSPKLSRETFLRIATFKRETAMIYQELLKLGDESLPIDPKEQQRVIRLGVRLHELRELEAQAWKAHTPNEKIIDPIVFHGGLDVDDALSHAALLRVEGERVVRRTVGAYELRTAQQQARAADGSLLRRAQRQRAALDRKSAAELKTAKLKAIHTGQKARRKAKGEADDAEDLIAFTEAANTRLNVQINRAHSIIKGMSIERVYAEIAKATGETADAAARRLGDNEYVTPGLGRHLESVAAREELVLLRARTGNGNKPIARRVDGRQGLTTEHKRDLDRFEESIEAVEELLAAFDTGARPSGPKIRQVIREHGGTVKGHLDGGEVEITLPILGTIKDFLEPALRKARMFLKDYKPMMALAPVPGGAALSKSSGFMMDPGFMNFEDGETGKPGMAWMPSAAGAAALAGLGIVLAGSRKGVGFPIRMRGWVRLMRDGLRRQGTVPIQHKTGTAKHPSREGIVLFQESGDVVTAIGERHAISGQAIIKAMTRDGKLQVARGGRGGVVFSLHNHPIAPRTVARGGKGPGRQAVTTIERIMAQYPSGSDLDLAPALTNIGRRDVPPVFGIISPGNRVTLVRGQPSAGFASFVNQERRLKTAVMETVAKEQKLGATQLRKGLGLPSEKLTQGEIFGTILAAHGEAYLSGLIDLEYAARGIQIIRNVSDDAVEQVYLSLIGQGGSREAQAIAAETQRVLRDRTWGMWARKADDQAEIARIVKALTGAPIPPAQAAPRKVAPAGVRHVRAMLPETVTPSAASRPGHTLTEVQTWGKEVGLTIRAEVGPDDAPRLLATRADNGVHIASAPSSKELMEKITSLAHEAEFARKAARSGGIVPGQAGVVNRDLALQHFTRNTGFAIGSIAPVSAQIAYETMLQEPDPTDTESPMIRRVGMMLLGGVAGAILGAKLGRFVVNAQANRVLKAFIPKTDDLLKKHEVNHMMGQSSSKGTGPTETQFMKFPVEDQATHYVLRLRANLNSKGKKKADLQARLNSTVRKFIPAWIPEGRWDELEAITVEAGLHAGLTQREAEALWVGGLVKSLVEPFSVRGTEQFRNARPNLRSLATSHSDVIFGPNADLESIRGMYAMAEVITGPPAVAPSHAAAAVTKNYTNMLTGRAADWVVSLQAIAAEAGKKGFKGGGGRGGLDNLNRGPFGLISRRFFPTEQFFNAGRRMQKDREKFAVGEKMVRLYRAISNATEMTRAEGEALRGEIGRVFQNTTYTEQLLVGDILQNPKVMERMLVENPRVARVAQEFRAILDGVAEDLGIPKQELIENYFPWVYNAKTLREMRLAGFADPGAIHVPNGSGVAEWVIFKRFLPRALDTPFGDIEKNPAIVGNMYVTGAMRKKHLDPLLAQFDKKWWEDFHTLNPSIAGDMLTWFFDIAGVPSAKQLETLSRLRQRGLHLERIAEASARFGLPVQEFIQGIADRYFLGAGVTAKFTRVIRSFEFTAKIGANLISPLVNLSQLSNTLTDVGLTSILWGFGTEVLGATVGLADEQLKAAAKGVGVRAAINRAAGAPIKPLIAWINPRAQGTQKLKVMREIGVWSDNVRNLIDETNDLIALEKAASFGTIFGGGVAGALAGGTASAIIDPDAERQTNMLSAVGGSLAVMFSMSKVPARIFTSEARAAAITEGNIRTFRKALRSLKTLTVFPFTAAETINRSLTAGGASIQARRALKVAKGTPAQQRRAVAGEAIENVAIGAGAGAGFTAGDEDASTAGGAAFGSVAFGVPLAVAGLRRPRFRRVANELKMLGDDLGAVPFRQSLKALGPPTQAEVEKWYMRQVLDSTQFRFGREARPEFLRTRWGEVLGSLQTFTLNQMEFLDERMRGFADSLTQGVANKGAGRLAGGQMDVRIFRYAALMTGAAGALTALTISAGGDRSYEYWVSRIGIGLLPVLQYNESAEKWQLSSVVEHLQGPFIGDVYNATKVAWTLFTDPVAQLRFDEQLDTLARQVFSAFRSLETNVEGTARLSNALHAEGLGEFLQQRVGLAGQFGSQPVSTLAGTARPQGRGGGRSGGSGFSGSFEGGFGGGGFEGSF